MEADIRLVEKADRSRREVLPFRQETVQQRHCIVNSRWGLGDLARCGNLFDSITLPYFLAVVDEFGMGNSVRCSKDNVNTTYAVREIGLDLLHECAEV